MSFVSLAASVGLLIQDALVPEGPSAWTGTAGVLQCVLVLIRLVFLYFWEVFCVPCLPNKIFNLFIIIDV